MEPNVNTLAEQNGLNFHVNKVTADNFSCSVHFRVGCGKDICMPQLPQHMIGSSSAGRLPKSVETCTEQEIIH